MIAVLNDQPLPLGSHTRHLRVSVCIATYCRPDRLSALLDDLVRQSCLPLEVVVVDNDVGDSAREVVARRRALGCPFDLIYGTQPQQNISLTRNRSVALASGDWLAFIDDDERAAPQWLAHLVATALASGADGVLGPVVPVLPDSAPGWIRRGDFYGWPRRPSGERVPVNRLRFGNVLLRGSLLRDRPAPFDPAYGLTGGEDGELLGRLVQQGACLVWCDEAVVTEPVENARLRLRWLLLRGLRGGQDYARHRLSGRFGRSGPLGLAGRTGLLLRSAAQCAVMLVLVPLVALLGLHRAAQALVLAAGHAGKVSGCAGMHYREYAHVAKEPRS